MLRKISAFVLLVFGFSFFASAQNFEGIIEFKKQTGKNVVNYVYYIKGSKVRIDEFASETRNVEASFILGLKDSSMIYLNHKRKMWGTRKPSSSGAAPAGCVASQTKNIKEIFSYKCVENVVRNSKDSTEISFYIAPGKFTFFTPMMKLLNRQENFATYLLAVPLKEGSMPLLAIERDLLGNEKSRLEVTRLEQKTLAEGMFLTPKDFTEVK
ncbi:MAG: DUF4412 domain-containing protein [Bacteroidota bacterium]|nr:DUF4412 domain-containing protein [Bacteroidota bacterium]